MVHYMALFNLGPNVSYSVSRYSKSLKCQKAKPNRVGSTKARLSLYQVF